jgi:hypothetical protein
VLEREKSLFVGAKSYGVLNSMNRSASSGEILKALLADNDIVGYFNALGGVGIQLTDIEESLKRERLAYQAEGLPSCLFR